ncbi:MAG: dephospho-CoA kinase [Veillonellaceae bacterium]|nr:dephospho-CoA kinase [Veillonellaceae bacterium]
MYKIGLTGGIASGKSTVSTWLAKQGAPIIDADIIARQVVEKGQPCLKQLVEAFGQTILLADGRLNRPLVGQLVFTDKAKRQKLNQIMHKAIKEKMAEQAAIYEKTGQTAAIYDVPLLVETGWYQWMDEVWVVAVSPKTQLKRLMLRNQYTEVEAKERIASQMALADKIKVADKVIANDGTEDDLYKELGLLWQQKKGLFGK